MIVLAADYVGSKIAEYLVGAEPGLRTIVLDRMDRGGYNDAIERAARDNGVEVGYEDRLADAGFLRGLRDDPPELGILAGWPYLLKGELLEAPALGWVAAHPGLLPDGRGKHPYYWSIAEGTPFGVTLRFIDRGIDTGDVLVQERIEVGWEDTGASLYRKSRERLVELFERYYPEIREGRLERKPQDGFSETSRSVAAFSEDAILDLDAPCTPRELLNRIRGRMFPPSANTFFYENGKKYAVDVRIKEVTEPNS